MLLAFVTPFHFSFHVVESLCLWQCVLLVEAAGRGNAAAFGQSRSGVACCLWGGVREGAAAAAEVGSVIIECTYQLFVHNCKGLSITIRLQ